MNIFRQLFAFLGNDSGALRIGAAGERMQRLDELEYHTVSDSKREMRRDMQNLCNDFRKTVKNTTSEYGKESRAKQTDL